LLGAGACERARQHVELRLATDERRETARSRDLKPRAGRGADQLEDLDRLREALHRRRAEGARVDVPFDEPERVGRHDDRPGVRDLLHARRQVGGLADRRVVHAEVASDRAHDHFTGIQSDPDAHALAQPRLLGVLPDRFLHGERGVAGARGVLLERQRRPEEGHDAVTHDLVHRAFLAMNRVHHARQDGVQQLPRLLGITARQQLHRALQVGKEHRDLFALALDGALGDEDPLRQVLRRVALWRGGGWRRRGRLDARGSRARGSGERLTAAAAELLAGLVGEAARRASNGERGSAFTTEAPSFAVFRPAAGTIHSGMRSLE
jgi:hypothetical protein